MTSHTAWWPQLPSPSERPREVINLRQVVAYNMSLARKKRGMTQRELGDLLSQLTGRSWTVGAVSAAESIWDSPSPRPRSFDVLDLVAFSLALQLPLTWFLLPPSRTPYGDDIPPFLDWIELGKKRPEGEETDVELMSGRFLANLVLAHTDPDDPEGLMSKRLDAIPYKPSAAMRDDDDSLEYERLRHELKELLSRHDKDERRG